MTGPLLQTKLHLPRGRHGLVARPRLIERLTRGSGSVLTLVSAPAGFGKTTLLTEWIAADGRPAGWLSLDRRDNDPTTFWTYVITALRMVAPQVGAAALALLESPRTPVEDVLATLLNDLSTVPDDVVLVLDDYHVIDAHEVHESMGFLLEHLPPQLHIVIAGRADPALPLARMRVRGELVEVRAVDLRFTPDEAAAYLTGVMGLALTAHDVSTLEGRTEGWIAALQLAALSMQGRDDVAGFIAGFAGDDRYIVDYLAEEVLARQPDHLHRFLLQTSALERLSGPLCDAVTGQDGGHGVLAALERANLFLVPLDHRRRWYRYHHLFADVLRAHLQGEQPDSVHELHLRASSWYEQNGERSEAIRHAMAGEDFERAADLVELAIPATLQGRRETTLRRWLEALPEALVQHRPVLSNGFAGSLMSTGEIEGVEAHLLDAERWLDTTTAGQGSDAPSAGMVVVDDQAARRLPGAIAVHRAGQALLVGDPAATRTHARRALDLVDEDDHVARGAADALLGLACWTSGDLVAAHRWYTDAMASLGKAGYLSDVIGCAVVLADIRIAQGRLREAMSTYERGLQVSTEQAGPVLRGVADMHVGMSALLRERDDLESAMRHLSTSRDLGEHVGLPRNRYRWRVAMAGVRESEGDLGSALDLLDEAERLYVSDFHPDVRPVPALRARLWIAQGRLGEALDWARAQGLSVEDDLSYLREFEHITLARALLARYESEGAERSHDEAVRLLGRLLRAAEDGDRTGSVIEITVLQALALGMRGDVPAALAPLERALMLAEPEGHVRILVDEGPPMAVLLRAAAKRRIAPNHVRRLLTASGATQDRTTPGQVVIEPLSERELDVLRLLATDLGGPDIARRLIVSLNTVRTHTRNIYAKLGVNNRRAAVHRAEELELLVRTRHR
ncbi:LuxR C-terminal-related transcriptional regulator [Pseudonocardia broussonetiae]|uniref:Helix-turn-helix transcriptional regulator n=1 Tax=Pseudonocardia broussonetiae TaxID=2736640 RepID=A0A6M6JRH2_9PSEU|nr:LuxR C-terminal-related transcriptional regulator [Pseudonocardia broussonetiae]QJY48999.1 helix-turn-helix transcriptional regulator [Pseudonocardia broussonetiae]